MHITILTLFPEMFDSSFAYSIIARAIQKNIVDIQFVNFRNFATDRYGSVDDHPYGGGPGMILRVDVIDRALKSLKLNVKSEKVKIILLDPAGKTFNQSKAKALSTLDHLVLICGHYEGVDERIRSLVDEEISIGDFILTGGEIPAMVIVDSIIRLIPNVLKKPEATESESFTQNTLEYPQYTRPETYKGTKVPDVLLSGNHAKIATWKKNISRKRTKDKRPDLLKSSEV